MRKAVKTIFLKSSSTASVRAEGELKGVVLTLIDNRNTPYAIRMSRKVFNELYRNINNIQQRN